MSGIIKYKVGDQVFCKYQILPSGSKRITNNSNLELSFTILSISKIQDTPYHTFTILLPEDFLGWKVGRFHIEHLNIDPKYLGKKFFDITEAYLTDI